MGGYPQTPGVPVMWKFLINRGQGLYLLFLSFLIEYNLFEYLLGNTALPEGETK